MLEDRLLLTTAGSLDTTFDGDGKVLPAVGPGNATAFGLAVQSDGKVVAAWNGLAITALIEYGKLLDDPAAVRRAVDVATFLAAPAHLAEAEGWIDADAFGGDRELERELLVADPAEPVRLLMTLRG